MIIPVYTFSLFGSLVVNADILSSSEEKSAPQNTHPSGATKPCLTNLAYLDPDEGKFCKLTELEDSLPLTVPPRYIQKNS